MTISVRGTDATYGSITTASRLLNVGLTQNLFLPWVTRNGVLNASAAVTNGNFESGSVTWAEFSSNNVYPIIYSVSQGLPVTPVSGDYAAWMGGLNNEVSYVQQSVTVPANAPYLRFYRWMGSGDAPGYDFGRVKINGTTVLTFDLSQNTSGWVIHSVSLAAYAGQSVTLRFEATTDGSLISSWLLDDVSFSSMP
jgi:hypothetical protein